MGCVRLCRVASNTV